MSIQYGYPPARPDPAAQAVDWVNRGNSLQAQQHYEAALQSYAAAIQLKPDYAEAFWKHANTLHTLGRYESALDSYQQAIACKPDFAKAYSNRGVALHKLGQYQAALDSFQRAIELQPDYANAYNNCGLVYKDLKRFSEELLCYEQAIALQPEFAEAYNNRGNVLQNLKCYPEAVVSYQQALTLQPNHAKAANNLGLTWQQLKNYTAAQDCFTRAIALQPDYVEAYSNYAHLLNELQCFDQAATCFDQAFALRPDFNFLAGHRLQTRLQICCWTGLATELTLLAAKIGQGAHAAPPFTLLTMSDDPALQRQAAEIWTQAKYPLQFSLTDIPAFPTHQRIRIGYFSADFRNHPVAFLTAELFEIHDRTQFEIYAFAFGPDKQDPMRLRLEQSFDHFIDISAVSDPDAAQLARSLEIDIAVDLGGHTAYSRTGIFALRAAPLQLNYLGYAGTMGATYMDYLLADPVLIPAHNRVHYSENIVYLPDSFLPCDTTRPVADTDFQRADFGLPADGFVFCCFNNAYKIQPAVFDLWLGILAAVPSAVLWLPEFNPAATANLLAAAGQQGISADRLIFARQLPLVSEHLARLRLADLFLDTLPYNAHTTASDALWAGLPVLTCAGESFAGRVAASLLAAIGLPELITTTPADYQALAIELATQPRQLAAIKAKLAANRLTTPLFDIRRFTVHLEQAYRQMFSRSQAGLPPEDIAVATAALAV
ncbi:tetratricopeptide repeat protein [Methylomonas paludis]|uniref:protein O-GlcNAc transferase n=1 Tax=Methylomonas paludis TaxID=1173101 RepID=A0A975MKG9_9GAMM|nr:tetratricopeptide repeat protein [Methylomonas paludis]QWF69553.1 tetratricopeptide repeat protein [Methylomonas paludis]